ncbi:MAG TPA: hypothetical protein VIK25_01490, partial [Gemmatimonadaceae bacterium]
MAAPHTLGSPSTARRFGSFASKERAAGSADFSHIKPPQLMNADDSNFSRRDFLLRAGTAGLAASAV